MNNELIARVESIQYRLAETKKVCKVHGFVASFTQVFDDADAIIIDCRAEIERLEARIAELEKPYVAMTDDDWTLMYKNGILLNVGSYSVQRAIEATTIKRYNEQRSVK